MYVLLFLIILLMTTKTSLCQPYCMVHSQFVNIRVDLRCFFSRYGLVFQSNLLKGYQKVLVVVTIDISVSAWQHEDS